MIKSIAPQLLLTLIAISGCRAEREARIETQLIQLNGSAAIFDRVYDSTGSVVLASISKEGRGITLKTGRGQTAVISPSGSAISLEPGKIHIAIFDVEGERHETLDRTQVAVKLTPSWITEKLLGSNQVGRGSTQVDR